MMDPERFVVCETRSSTWRYHIRELPEGEGPKLGGLPQGTRALCGYDNVGWDTQIPLEAWGRRSHIPESWCTQCAALFEKAGEGR
jgi:hypothetical protein